MSKNNVFLSISVIRPKPHEGDLLHGFLEQPIDRGSDLENPEHLAANLRRGWKAVLETFEKPITEFRRSMFLNPSETADFSFHSLSW